MSRIAECHPPQEEAVPRFVLATAMVRRTIESDPRAERGTESPRVSTHHGCRRDGVHRPPERARGVPTRDPKGRQVLLLRRPRPNASIRRATNPPADSRVRGRGRLWVIRPLLGGRTSASRGRRLGVIGLAFSIVLATTGTLSAASAGAQGTLPSVRLVVGQSAVTVKRPPGRRAFLDLGVYVAAVGGSFEVWAKRPDYDHPATISQVVRSGTDISSFPLPGGTVMDWNGFTRFLRVTVKDASGNVILDRYHPFCPGAGDLVRVNDEGPDVPTYPVVCYGGQFTLGAVWGIDDGWASNAFGYGSNTIDGPDGRYTATVSIPPRYQRLFGIAAIDASVTVAVRVKTTKGGRCRRCPADARPATVGGKGAFRRASAVPVITNPDPSILPDLVALPASVISIKHRKVTNRDFLEFSATVWNAGPSPLDVEGFRKPNTKVMDGWEYFYSNGVPVGRAPAGDMVYDTRPGHHHWHFEQFARYSLLTAGQSQVVRRSQKQGFCITWTGPIDLTIQNAVWNPGLSGLSTASCGYGRGALWVREVLPVAWGDTYYQSIPGQSFDITDLPNGAYLIQVTANPKGQLVEGSTSNNTQLRRVILGGRPGHRTVRVPPWHGIDTEGGAAAP